MYVPQEALDLFDQGCNADDIVRRKVLNKEGKPASSRTARRWKLYWTQFFKKDKPVVIEVVESKDSSLSASIEKLIKNKPMSLRELSESLDRSESSIEAAITDLVDQGHNISKNERMVELSTVRSVQNVDRIPGYIADSMELKIAVPSDTHKGSKAEQITNLRRFIAYARERGFKKFCIPGDLTSGRNGYKGQSLEQYAHTAEQQIEAFNRDIWPLPDESWYVLGGNHDFWHITNGGTDIVWRICKQHSNMYFMGYDYADVPLTDKTKIRMWHPTGGVPYSHCLSEDSQILTKRGWVGYDTISMSDEIATLNQETGELEYQYPQELIISHYRGKMIHFQSRTVDHLVTPNHDMWVRPYAEGKGTGKWGKRKAKDLLEVRRQEFQLTMLAKWKGTEKESYRIPFKPWSGAHDLGEVPMDSFLTFLGWYVSEGHLQQGKVVCVTNTDPDAVERIAFLMEDIGINPKIYTEDRGDRKTVYRVRGNSANLARWLASNVGDGASNKRVPRFIMDLSPRQIGLFLDSLFEGDGTKKAGRRWHEYNSVSSGLLDDVQELLLKVGKAGTKAENRVGVLDQAQPTINNTPEEIEDYSGIIWCVRVPNGVIYARRNGKAIWTGNSYRLQKGMENVAYEQLLQATENPGSQNIVLYLVGHLHVEVSMQRGSILAAQCGCFEGQTNYLVRKGLYPQIGGYLFTLYLNDAGNISRSVREFISFPEIKEDFKNYEEVMDTITDTDKVEIMYQLEAA